VFVQPVALGFLTCAEAPDNRQQERLHLFVSILPQQYFVGRVAGDLVDVEVMVKPGQSPATFDPTPKQMSLLAEADAYFRIGVPFENTLLDKLTSTFRSLKVVDTRAGVEFREMEGHHHESEHPNGYQDPHIWLAPKLVKQQASTICGVLAELDSSHANSYRRNLEAFHRELDSVDQVIATILEPYIGRRLYVYHPSYGYFADAYRLEQVPVEIEGKEPSAQQLVQVMAELKQAECRVLFVQPQFSTSTAVSIADAIGGKVVPLDPLSVDYMNNLVEIAHRIADALNEGAMHE
jgi:zinc transport system substrate-binding protein